MAAGVSDGKKIEKEAKDREAVGVKRRVSSPSLSPLLTSLSPLLKNGSREERRGINAEKGVVTCGRLEVADVAR